MRTTDRRSRRGSALSVALLVTFVAAGMATAMLTVSAAARREDRTRISSAERRLLAHRAAAEGVLELTQGGDGVLGSRQAPVLSGPGGFWSTVTDLGGGSFAVTGYGIAAGESRAVRTVVRERGGAIFTHALFAGNGSSDPSYVLTLGGTGKKADTITGDIYSGSNVAVTGDAVVDGEIRAGGTVSGAAGTGGVVQNAPDLSGMHYDTNHDVNVASEFTSRGTSKSNSSLGGTAIQVPEDSPAHIFRKNPSDRSSVTRTTAKDDYFLEDPYESVNSSSSVSANNATPITLSGVSGEPGPSGTKKTYFIDGNLWIHNLNIYNFVIKHTSSDGVQVTFVVRGNVYISDNLLLRNAVKDGIALIAIKDSSVADSGNIYFGDPVFGTLEQMDAFMYAERNFVDNNLDATGSLKITLNGVMSAGNQVNINNATPRKRPQLILKFDPRIRDGSLALPGLPSTPAVKKRKTFDVLAEFEVDPDV